MTGAAIDARHAAISSRARRHNVVQGEFFATNETDGVLTTILGSCVAACIRDPALGLGGMNHFLLPGDGVSDGAAEGARYGAFLMEVLINDLLRRGARKGRLEAKLFGGANVINGLSDVGSRNAAFARRFLRDEKIPCVGGSLGGAQARRVEYWPSTGVARQRLLSDVRSVSTEAPARLPAAAGDLELFD